MKTSPEALHRHAMGSLSPIAGTTDCTLADSTPELLAAKWLSPL